MKANGGFFKGTSGNLKYKLDIQRFAKGKISIKAKILLSITSNNNLKNTIKELYRPGAKIGDGGTAAAIKKQLKYSLLIGGKDHTIKGKERIKNLENLLKSGKLNKTDTQIAKKLKKDLEKALGGK